tara:strand:- start:981 stop:1574 length:594 start_codon:yes stop_codon:yes gene_type:complete
MSEVIVDTLKHSGNSSTANLTLASNGNVTVAGALSAGSFVGAGKLLRKTYLEIPRNTFTQSYFPNDDTAPQITEGAEAWSGAYTPSTASCDLFITATFTQAEASNVGDAMTSALFVSGTNDALQVRSFYNVGSSTEHNSPVTMIYKMASWGTTEKTFSIRFGGGNCINYAWYTSGLATTLYSADACKTGFVIEEIST